MPTSELITVKQEDHLSSADTIVSPESSQNGEVVHPSPQRKDKRQLPQVNGYRDTSPVRNHPASSPEQPRFISPYYPNPPINSPDSTFDPVDSGYVIPQHYQPTVPTIPELDGLDDGNPAPMYAASRAA